MREVVNKVPTRNGRVESGLGGNLNGQVEGDHDFKDVYSPSKYLKQFCKFMQMFSGNSLIN